MKFTFNQIKALTFVYIIIAKDSDSTWGKIIRVGGAWILCKIPGMKIQATYLTAMGVKKTA